MKFKDFLIKEGISQEDFSKMTPDEMAKVYSKYNDARYDALEEKIKLAGSIEDTAKLETKLTGIFEEIKKTGTENGLEIAKLQGEGGKEEKGTILSAVEKVADVLGKVFDTTQVKNVANFTVKADVLAGTAITNSTIAYRDTELSPLAHRKLTMYNMFRKINIGKNTAGTVVYIDWDTGTTARAAAMVAEGALFPESTAKWAEYSVKIKKIGDTIPVSEEMLVDLERFAGELSMFLETNVKLVEDNQLLEGDGTGNNIFGLDARAAAYTPAASGITDASFYDLVPILRADIVFGKGSKFSPNVVLMNLKEINKYKLKKDANNNYIMPPFVTADGNTIDGVVVMENNDVADNVCYMGDSRYARIYEGSEGYSITVGEVDAQFAEDMKTLKARKRLALLIKESEKAAWRKVSSISGALTTLAT